MGHLNHHILNNLCTLSDELEEVKLASPPPELAEDHLLDTQLDAFDRISLLPELEVEFAGAT